LHRNVDGAVLYLITIQLKNMDGYTTDHINLITDNLRDRYDR
jgi:hypothetical protein